MYWTGRRSNEVQTALRLVVPGRAGIPEFCDNGKVLLGRARRAIYAGFGLVCVVLGVIGAFLPVLPTTPFLILALWAFSSSSKRLEAWLLTHKRFGPRLRAWRTHRVIPLAVKLTAWGSMVVSLTIMTLVGAPTVAIVASAGLMAIGALYIAHCPSRLQRDPSDESMKAS